MKKWVGIVLGLMVFFSLGQECRAEQLQKVVLETSLGDIVLELDAKAAPRTVDNFLKYVDAEFYNGTIFHRVIKTFMIQGGGFSPELVQKKTNIPIINEADNGLANKRGTIAMARTGNPHSATSQFFINTVDNAMLNHTGKNQSGWGYCVFGKVISGMDVLDAIAAKPTTSRGMHQNVPQEIIVIKGAKRLSSEPSAP